MAKTLRNSGADLRSTKAPRPPPLLKKGPTPISTSTKGGKKQDDRRLLVTVERGALLSRPEPFALRQELCKATGLSLADIPQITPTRTGWAINPADLTTRDLLTSQKNTETITRILQGTAVKQPETWYNYAVPGVPTTIHQLLGGVINTAGLVAEEVVAQTKAKPVSCRPSRHGANPLTGRITWVVSFRTPVRPFRLFNASELSNLIERRAQITRHDLGCQGYCNPARCNRYARCGTCSTRVDQHDGPVGANCTQEARCANCHGPFPAGHEHCPAAPRRKDGKVLRPTRADLRAIRRHGERNFQAANAPSTGVPTPAQEPEPTPQAPSTALGGPKRKRGAAITAYENASAQSRAPSSQPASSLEAHPQPPSSRPRRSTVISKSLNLDELLARSIRDMEIDSTITLC